MSFPNRDNNYSFDSFLEWRKKFDYYRDDIFLQKVIKKIVGDEWEKIDHEVRKMSPKVSYRWRDFADKAALRENKPWIEHYDAHNHRIDRIVRPLETESMEREIFSEGLFSSRTSSWLKLVKMFLIYQNGEACISCPVTCTEGLVAILEKYVDSKETQHILKHCKEGIDGDYAIGAQYISEIQGGSDISSNLLEAVNEKGVWHLYGQKFFCSATHADYAIVTAKPIGSEKVGLFVVPSWLTGNKKLEKRNGYTIDRIKWKMGTSELTTAEITYNGAIAFQVGPLQRGLANVVGLVLTYSRLTVGLSAAASMMRAAREAAKYCELREAFDRKLIDFPMVSGQVKKLLYGARRTIAGAFKMYQLFLNSEGSMNRGFETNEPLEMKKKRFDVREMIMLQKITASWDATDYIRIAMSLFGGHGVMEDFSSLPRLYRDAAVNELWEGPRNVLLLQIYRDFKRVTSFYSPVEFVNNLLKDSSESIRGELAIEIEDLVNGPSLTDAREGTEDRCARWDTLCHNLWHRYQDQVFEEIDS